MTTLSAFALAIHMAPPVPQHCLRPLVTKAAFVTTVHEGQDADELFRLKRHLRAETCGADIGLLPVIDPTWDQPYLGGKRGFDYNIEGDENGVNFDIFGGFSYGGAGLRERRRGRDAEPYVFVLGGSLGGDLNELSSRNTIPNLQPIFADRTTITTVTEVAGVSIAPVPAPASVWLLLAGIAGLWRVRG